jgi:ribosomal protein S18 acetylase RimI-like enzyme
MLTMKIVDPERDMDAVAFVLNMAAQWLTGNGIDQWPTDFNEGGGWRLEKLREQARRGCVVLLTWGQGPTQIPIGTATVTDWADPDFASAWPDGPDNALYLMRLAITPAARRLAHRQNSPGLGSMLISHAKHQVISADKRYLRLDCSRTNEKLHSYYLGQGFERIGTVAVDERRSGALFQFDTMAPTAPAPLSNG